MIKHDIHLTVSGLGSMTGTTERVFPFVLHSISCESDGYGRTFEGFVVLLIFLKTKNRCSTRKICHTHLLYTHLLILKIGQMSAPKIITFSGSRAAFVKKNAPVWKTNNQNRQF
jgi:hypothetical protein